MRATPAMPPMIPATTPPTLTLERGVVSGLEEEVGLADTAPSVWVTVREAAAPD